MKTSTSTPKAANKTTKATTATKAKTTTKANAKKEEVKATLTAEAKKPGRVKIDRKVGDIHPNGLWVWTKTPTSFDWRVIKQPVAPVVEPTPAPKAKATTKPKAGSVAVTTAAKKGGAVKNAGKAKK